MTKPLPRSVRGTGSTVGKNPKVSPGARTVFLTVEGEQVRPKDAFWIVYNPAGTPIDFFSSELNIGDDVASAARSYWLGAGPALHAMNAGYRMKLVTQKTFIKDIARNLREDDTPQELRGAYRDPINEV